MRIGILGSGLMGGKLGTIFARAGHEVVFSYARSKEKLKKLARDVHGKAHGSARMGTPSEAAQEADALLLAVHWSQIEDVLRQTGDLSGKVVVTCSLPMNDQLRTRCGAHLVGRGGTCQETAERSGRFRIQHCAKRGAVWRIRNQEQEPPPESGVLRRRRGQQSCRR
jgi:predicted dinucleotide-binding enzyme